MKNFSKLLSVTVGLMAFLSGAPAHADDSEVFTSAAVVAPGARPNVLFIIDTSGSMDAKVSTFPKKRYDGACNPDRIYYRSSDTKEPPDCGTDRWISEVNNRCYAMAQSLAQYGWWRGQVQMLDKHNDTGGLLTNSVWSDMIRGYDGKVECASDYKKHGDLPGTTPSPGTENNRARTGTGNADANRWGNTSSNELVWSGKQTMSFYSGSYANWYNNATNDDGSFKTRLEIVQEVSTNLIDELKGVNLGVMRYDQQAAGGMVTFPVSELTDDNRTKMKEAINAYTHDGYTPMSETLYEAYLYMTGQKMKYGDSSVPEKSHPDSRVGGTGTTYKTPMQYSCQNNYIVFLTDGLPTKDSGADTEITALAGSCPDKIPDPDPDYPYSGRCLEPLTGYMFNHDLSALPGEQKITSYYIGFGSDVSKSASFLDSAAKAGGTDKAFTQDDAAGLTATLMKIFSNVIEESDTTFVAPAVSVNAFNRAQNLNELYMSVFAPTKTSHWAGNLKKYRIYKNDIYGIGSGATAVDDKGIFRAGTQAVNSSEVDGSKTILGGAAKSLPTPAERNLYTWIKGNSKDLFTPENAIKIENTKVTEDLVDATSADDREDIINFARGEDLKNEVASSPQHYHMGDPMHARPAILIHGGTEAAPEGTIFVPTNDGMLHAFEMLSSDTLDGSGNATVRENKERWAFVPEDFLGRLNEIFDDAAAPTRKYTLDGDVRVFKYDLNQDGVIDVNAGDKAYVFFGTGRGGNAYYALDVSTVDKPKFLWKIDKNSTGMSKLGQTWSTPQIARVNISDVTQNTQKFVLIFGGGYDTDQDAPDSDPYVFKDDDEGNAIFMIDLETGAKLWSASATGANFNHASMTSSIPGSITVLDTNSDKFADRMYAADMGGQVWRFDISNGKPVADLVAGSVIAALGNKGLAKADQTAAGNRRFYYAPDVAPITSRGSRPYFNIALGSGYRGHPLNKTIVDSFYSLRDYNAYIPLDQAAYDLIKPVVDSDTKLVDITSDANAVVADGSVGWKLRLNLPGEKVLAESTTASGVIFFPTYSPTVVDDKNPCLPTSINRAYAVYAANGRPFTRWGEGTAPLTASDRYTETTKHGIAPAISIFQNPDNPNGMGICQTGAMVLKRCVKFGSAIRSYWEHK